MPPSNSSWKIVFVYNAEKGFFNALTDTAHKIFSPSTYECSLCRFTYGLTGMLMPWKRFIDSLDVRPAFFHRSEFRKAYPDFAVSLPVVFRERQGRREIVLSAQQIAATGSVDALISAVKDQLAELDKSST